MPIQRFRSHEAARSALWLEPDDPRLIEKIQRVWRLAHQLAPGPRPRGVFRFRTIEEANEHREQWIDERVERLRASRLTPDQ